MPDPPAIDGVNSSRRTCDVSHEPDDEDSAAPDTIRNDPPHRRTQQHAGRIHTAEKANVATDFSGAGAGHH